MHGCVFLLYVVVVDAIDTLKAGLSASHSNLLPTFIEGYEYVIEYVVIR